MIQRCTNQNNKYFHNYGGRGIVVCKEWRSFANFYKDMGSRPSKAHSLDRIDNNLGYSKDNCRWETKSMQGINMRVYRTNRTGVAGVSWRSDMNTYRVRIYMNGKTSTIGEFKTLDEAKEARRKAEDERRALVLAGAY